MAHYASAFRTFVASTANHLLEQVIDASLKNGAPFEKADCTALPWSIGQLREKPNRTGEGKYSRFEVEKERKAPGFARASRPCSSISTHV